MKQRKFTKGETIDSVLFAVDAITHGKWVYYNHKPMHPKWMEHWSICQIKIAVHSGRLFYAIPTEISK